VANAAAYDLRKAFHPVARGWDDRSGAAVPRRADAPGRKTL